MVATGSGANLPRIGKTHFVKSWPEMFEPAIQGIKGFDFRNNDRNYQVGDKLIQREYIPAIDLRQPSGYTGRAAQFHILRVWRDIPGLPEGFCILEVRGPEAVYFLDPNWDADGFVSGNTGPGK